MSSAAIYVRQSVDKKDSISIESQIEFCRKVLAPGEEYQVYSDKGYSGKNTRRPGFLKMLEDIKEGGISKVVVYKVDRISRALVDFSGMMEFFGTHGVEFVSATQPIDTTNPMGKAMLGVVMIFAQLERETIQQRVRDNYYERGSKGFYLGGCPPFGFDKIPARLDGKSTSILIPNIHSADVVRMYSEYARKDCSLGELAFALEQAGIKTVRKKSWSTSALSRALRNPVYAKADAEVYRYLKSKGVSLNTPIEEFTGERGCYLYGERGGSRCLSGCCGTLGFHEGLIHAETWLECQQKLDKNRPLKNSGKGTHSWLSGMLFCGSCGYAVSIVRNRRGKRYINCGGRKLKICPGRTVPVYPENLETCAELVITKLLEELMCVSFFPTDSVTEMQINTLKIEQIQLMQKTERLLEKIQLCEEISAEFLNRALADVYSRQKEIENEIRRLKEKRQGNAQKLSPELARVWKDYPFSLKKQLAGVFFKKIIVFDMELTFELL